MAAVSMCKFTKTELKHVSIRGCKLFYGKCDLHWTPCACHLYRFSLKEYFSLLFSTGCFDNTVRVWNHKRGTQLTLFDAHFPVIGLVLTETANRVVLQLANNNHVPILCLHNSPARPKQLHRNPPEVMLSAASVRASILGTCISSLGSRADMSGKYLLFLHFYYSSLYSLAVFETLVGKQNNKTK